jgi:preprotein translocase subunit SecE
MDEETIDWLLVGIVFVIFIIAVLYGFGADSQYSSIGVQNIGGYIGALAFLVYGGAGLWRKRILFGSGARLLKGTWAILVSLLFFAIGCLGAYEFISKQIF